MNPNVNFSGKKLSTAEKKERNRKRRHQKRMEQKSEYLEELETPHVFLHAGKRCISPYWHTYRCFSKHRWVDKPLLDVLIKEFPSLTGDFFKASVQRERLTLNGEVIREEDQDVKLKLHDVIRHVVHRHEPPVLDQPITILENLAKAPRAGVFAANKPPSMPVHPCGGYNFNSLIRIILQPPFSFPSTIQPIHRLDKLTSGVVIMGDSPQLCSEISKEIQSRTVSKSYIALVSGKLGIVGEEFCVDEPLWTDPAGRLLGKVDRENGKEACTEFIVLAQDEENTLVLCSPITGRTHQIRIHLKHLGYPIMGDPLYQLQSSATDIQYEITQILFPRPMPESVMNDPSQSFNSPEYQCEKDDICTKCDNPVPDHPLHTMYMCLHSVYYTGNGWSFFAEPPFWAQNLLHTNEIRDCVFRLHKEKDKNKEQFDNK